MTSKDLEYNARIICTMFIIRFGAFLSYLEIDKTNPGDFMLSLYGKEQVRIQSN